jgi:hypothetical protein
LPLQSRSPEKGPPFPFHVYYYSSSQKFSLLSKFKRAFETIRKNNKDGKKTLRKYKFRKPRRKVSTSEHVGLIFIFDFEEEQE